MRLHVPWPAVGTAFALMLSACASHPPAPVIDLTNGNASDAVATATKPQNEPGPYTVQAGDSLYTIAFRHDLDWRKLARWNAIAAPYTIYPGMSLRLDKPANLPAQSAQPLDVQAVVASTPATVSTLPTPTPTSTGTKPSAVASVPSTVAATPVTEPQPSPVAPPSQAQPVSAPEAVRRAGDVSWSWPNAGPVITSFRAGDPTRHGIDIAGTTGEPVLATANGVVVYSGNGLVGYGELVIIKHSDAFLSAYGHNSKRLVQEGQRVRRGEKIAEMGSSGTSRTELHFEIRRQGDPVDPLAFLPHR